MDNMKLIENMSLEEKLGQLIVFGFPGHELTETAIEIIDKYKAGNIIIFAQNLDTIEQTKELTDSIRETVFESTGILPFISIDQEGGVVSRLPHGAAIMPSAMAVRASNNPENAHKAAYLSGLELQALGFNVNFAPVMDINNNPQNPVIGVRSYGATAEEVSAYSIPSFEGYVEAGVLPVAKHFPGHGDTDVDSHLGLPTVAKSREELMNLEFVPFKEAIEQGLPAVMNAHILYPAIEAEELPATLSKTIMKDILRDELGFDGLIFSDCFEMQAIAKNYGTVKSFAKAIENGIDQILISHSTDVAIEALKHAKTAVESGELSMERIDEAVTRVLAYKATYTNPSTNWDNVSSAEALELSKKITRDAISRQDNNGDLPVIDENTLFLGSVATRSTFVSSDPTNTNIFAQNMAQEFGAKFVETSIDPDSAEQAEVLSLTEDAQTIVYGTYNGHLSTGQIELANKLVEAGHELVVVALRNPFDLPLVDDRAYKLAAFDYSLNSFASVVEVLRGGEARGVLNI